MPCWPSQAWGKNLDPSCGRWVPRTGWLKLGMGPWSFQEQGWDPCAGWPKLRQDPGHSWGCVGSLCHWLELWVGFQVLKLGVGFATLASMRLWQDHGLSVGGGFHGPPGLSEGWDSSHFTGGQRGGRIALLAKERQTKILGPPREEQCQNTRPELRAGLRALLVGAGSTHLPPRVGDGTLGSPSTGQVCHSSQSRGQDPGSSCQD